MSNPLIQLLVLAAVAVFLILRLRGVLGTRDGFEPTQTDQPVQQRLDVIEDDPNTGDSDLTDHVDPDSPAHAALVEMKRVEPSFSLTDFLGGARQAYEMILVGFEKGDLDEVRPFLAPEVAAAFDGAIEARRNAGLTTEVQFLGTRETALSAAEFDPATRNAEISVRFVGEMIVATRDQSGEVVEGDPRTARKQRDTWTFEREMGAADPNWRLVATGA